MFSKKPEVIWQRLNGIVCAYKPVDASVDYVIGKLKDKICVGLNELDTAPPRMYIDTKFTSDDVSVEVRPSFADNFHCKGPSYVKNDVKVHYSTSLGKRMSGVIVLGINKGMFITRELRKCHFTKCYQVSGIFGHATSDFHIDGKLLSKARYDHIVKFQFDKMLSSYQAANQKRIFTELGLDIRSQEAYDMAVSGLYRPKEKGMPIIYSLKTVNFNLPEFTIEVQCINENEVHLMNMIHLLGISLKSLATCTGIRCIRQGCFKVEHALLIREFNLENIFKNMEKSMKVLEEHYPETIGYKSSVNVRKSNNQSEQSLLS